ncbi:MAG TPA: hypothetical protein VNS58_07785 [Puia sp.]|nr:hypothetical protein [Puia sp.]
MIKKILFALLFAFTAAVSFGQSIDSLKLTDTEIPAGYSKSDELLCVTPHASSFYDQTDLYAGFLGKVTRKEFQSFGKKGDKGSILYFEFEKDFKGEGFLKGLLWGQESKPTRSEPDEYYVKGKILVIWSFNLKSELKAISKAKVTRLMP